MPAARLKVALVSEGVEPCRGCPRADECETGKACQVFSRWAGSQRTISDEFFWQRHRRKHPTQWEPRPDWYASLFGGARKGRGHEACDLTEALFHDNRAQGDCRESDSR